MLADPVLAIGGPGPETGQGIISTAACAGNTFYVGGGRSPDGTTCATGQILSVDAATGAPGWSRCVGNVIGAISTAGGQLVFGTDGCTSQPDPGCADAIDVCAAGGECTAITTEGPVLSGAAITDGRFLIAAGATVAAVQAD